MKNTPSGQKKRTEKNAGKEDVTAYIAAWPRSTRAKLTQLREIIGSAAPEAKEGISYGMPYYKYEGARLGFASFKNHIGLFGIASVVKEYRQELKGYSKTAKGTVRFALDAPLPAGLIRKLVKARIKKSEARQKK